MRRINVTHYLNNFNLNPVLQVRWYIKALNRPDAFMLHLCSKTAAEPIRFHTNQWMCLHQPRFVAFWLIHSSNILEPSTELNKTSIYARWWSKSHSVYYYLFIIIIIHDHMWIILLSEALFSPVCKSRILLRTEKAVEHTVDMQCRCSGM